MNYEGLVWSPKSSSGTTTWTPAPAWGWTDVTNAQYGYVTYDENVNDCTIPPHGLEEEKSQFSNFYFHDYRGNSHKIQFTFTNTCGNVGPPTSTGTYSLTDNSGYTVYRNGLSFVVFDKNGAQYSVPSYITYDGYQEQTQPGSATFTDTNGNQISASSTKVFTDTMGKAVLTVSGAAPNPVVYTYTDPNGTPQTVTVNYTSYTVQTAFNVSGITEYNQPNIPLVSSIVYSGDGSSYSFTYEPTPNNSSAVTGRIASITLRTGGTISYAYTGGSNGIEPDGTTAGLTRTTSDGPTAYTRPEILSSMSYTSIQDALGNVTASAFIFNSAGYFYETDHAVYNGAAGGTPLLETTTCYNASSPPTRSLPSVFSAVGNIVLSTYRNGVLLNTETQTYTGPELLATDYNSASNATTTYSYNTYTGPNSIPFYRLASSVSAVGSTNFQQTTYGYDETTPTSTSDLPQHISVLTQRGNLTSIHQTIDSSGSTLNTTNTYDDTGTMLTSTGPNGTTTYGYDSTDTLVTSVTPPTPSSGVSLPVSGTYDPNTGLVISTTDPNGTQTTYKYNGMLLPTEIEAYSGVNMVGKTAPGYPSANQTSLWRYQNASTFADTETLYDGYGRQSRVFEDNLRGAGRRCCQRELCSTGASQCVHASIYPIQNQ